MYSNNSILFSFVISYIKKGHFINNGIYFLLLVNFYKTMIWWYRGNYLLLTDRKHNTIGPNIASRRITLASNNHNEPYVYNP